MKPLFSHPAGFLRHAALMLLVCATAAFAQAGRIYTAPEPGASGGIAGRVREELTHAVAVEHDRVRVFRAELSENGTAFRLEGLPTGKYDFVLFTKSGTIFEGLSLGSTPKLDEIPAKNLEQRVAVADGFFNRCRIHRTGISEDGDTVLALVERFRANNVLKQSGEALGQIVRRFEIIELTRATDDWQLSASRHFYREGEPIPAHPDFRRSVQLPALGGVRVTGTVKDLGEIALPK